MFTDLEQALFVLRQSAAIVSIADYFSLHIERCACRVALCPFLYCLVYVEPDSRIRLFDDIAEQ